MSWRLATRLSVVVLALLVALLVAVVSLRTLSSGQSLPSTASTNTSGSQGTDLGEFPRPTSA
jgi:protein SCO1